MEGMEGWRMLPTLTDAASFKPTTPPFPCQIHAVWTVSRSRPGFCVLFIFHPLYLECVVVSQLCLFGLLVRLRIRGRRQRMVFGTLYWSRVQCPGSMPGDLHTLLAPVGLKTNRLCCFQTWVIIWGAVLASGQCIMNSRLHPKQSEILQIRSRGAFEQNPGVFSFSMWICRQKENAQIILVCRPRQLLSVCLQVSSWVIKWFSSESNQLQETESNMRCVLNRAKGQHCRNAIFNIFKNTDKKKERI